MSLLRSSFLSGNVVGEKDQEEGEEVSPCGADAGKKNNGNTLVTLWGVEKQHYRNDRWSIFMIPRNKGANQWEKISFLLKKCYSFFINLIFLYYKIIKSFLLRCLILFFFTLPLNEFLVVSSTKKWAKNAQWIGQLKQEKTWRRCLKESSSKKLKEKDKNLKSDYERLLKIKGKPFEDVWKSLKCSRLFHWKTLRSGFQ